MKTNHQQEKVYSFGQGQGQSHGQGQGQDGPRAGADGEEHLQPPHRPADLVVVAARQGRRRHQEEEVATGVRADPRDDQRGQDCQPLGAALAPAA